MNFSDGNLPARVFAKNKFSFRQRHGGGRTYQGRFRSTEIKAVSTTLVKVKRYRNYQDHDLSEESRVSSYVGIIYQRK